MIVLSVILAAGLIQEVSARDVPLGGRFETSVVNARSYANPFTDVMLAATFTRPDKSRVSFWGFHDGDGQGGQTGDVWKLRFMPDQVGTWSYECSFPDGAPGAEGTFRCVADGGRPGPLRLDPANPHGWVSADGSHFFPRAYTAPELFVAGNHARKPVFAFETSWEGDPQRDPLRLGAQATPGKLSPDQVRTGAWGSLMGGAFYLYAECFEPTLTWGNGNAFRFIEIMHDFLGGLAYWKLQPDPALVNSGSLCLADPGREYVVYRQSGGTITIDLPGAGAAFKAEWLDPRTGAGKTAVAAEGGAKQTFSCPDKQDWVLHLRSH